MPQHGSAIVQNERCVIITGDSGVGKSTLLGAFLKRGASFLTDDVAAVTLDENEVPWVAPSYPQQKLWRDSSQNLGYDTSKLPKIRLGIDKYAVSLKEHFCRTPQRLSIVCELKSGDCREVCMSRLSGIEKLKILMKHTYRKNYLSGLGLKAEQLRQCAAIAAQVSVFRMTRPKGLFSDAEQVSMLEQMLR